MLGIEPPVADQTEARTAKDQPCEFTRKRTSRSWLTGVKPNVPQLIIAERPRTHAAATMSARQAYNAEDFFRVRNESDSPQHRFSQHRIHRVETALILDSLRTADGEMSQRRAS